MLLYHLKWFDGNCILSSLLLIIFSFFQPLFCMPTLLPSHLLEYRFWLLCRPLVSQRCDVTSLWKLLSIERTEQDAWMLRILLTQNCELISTLKYTYIYSYTSWLVLLSIVKKPLILHMSNGLYK